MVTFYLLYNQRKKLALVTNVLVFVSLSQWHSCKRRKNLHQPIFLPKKLAPKTRKLRHFQIRDKTAKMPFIFKLSILCTVPEALVPETRVPEALVLGAPVLGSTGASIF